MVPVGPCMGSVVEVDRRAEAEQDILILFHDFPFRTTLFFMFCCYMIHLMKRWETQHSHGRRQRRRLILIHIHFVVRQVKW